MKISDIIDDLQKFKEMYGDLEVKVLGRDMESDEILAPVYALIPITDGPKDPQELIICCEELYYHIHAENESFSPA